MVAWKVGEPEIKLSFKRELAKGMQDTPKKYVTDASSLFGTFITVVGLSIHCTSG